MNRIILTFAAYGLLSCSVKDSSTPDSTVAKIDSSTTNIPADKNFILIEDFEETKNTFRPDTFELYDQSTDGGQLIAFHTKDKDYLVLDIWLFGETQKNTTYWTDKHLSLKIVKQTNYVYDKPYYEEGYKTKETTEFYSYLDDSCKIYDAEREEIKDSDNSTKEKKIRDFFTDVTKDIQIIK